MNVPESVHCSGCGGALGLEPVTAGANELRCANCDEALAPFCGGPGKLHDCTRCGGQFVEHALLRALVERREVYGDLAPRRREPENPLSQPLRYVPCPVCTNMMNRKNFGGTSGIIVDVCAQHGVWFDEGELPLVLAFVEDGGLARERLRKQQERALRPSGLPQSFAPVASSAEISPLDAAGWLEDVFAGVAELVQQIRDRRR